jgi:hypothetical protein
VWCAAPRALRVLCGALRLWALHAQRGTCLPLSTRASTHPQRALLTRPLPRTCTCRTHARTRSGELDPPFPAPVSLSTALSYFADLLSSPRKDALLGLASCARDEKQAAKLAYLASPQGKAEYTSYIAKPHRSLLEVRRRGWAGVGGRMRRLRLWPRWRGGGGGGGGRGGNWGPRALALCARAPQPRVPLATPAAHRRRLRAPGARS